MNNNEATNSSHTVYSADKLGFGVWGMAPAYPTYHMDVDEFEKYVAKGYMNTYVMEMEMSDRLIAAFDIIKETGGSVWLDAKTGAYKNIEGQRRKMEVVLGWEEIREIYRLFKGNGLLGYRCRIYLG